jgi:hypothetical protein
MALSSIAIKQTKRTTSTMEKAKQLHDYLAANPDATMRFKASNMIMNIHSDMMYLLEANACSRACGHFSWDGTPKTATLSNKWCIFLPFAPSSVLSLHPQPKPNSELSSLTTKRV